MKAENTSARVARSYELPSDSATLSPGFLTLPRRKLAKTSAFFGALARAFCSASRTLVPNAQLRQTIADATSLSVVYPHFSHL